MTFTERLYVYATHDDGSKEFLHTFLNKTEALKYVDKHKKVFPHRFKHYEIGNHSTDMWEVV